MADLAPPRRAARAALALRRRVRNALDRVLPREAVLWELSMGVAHTRMLGTIAELGVADALAEGPATAAEVARRLDLDADALHRVLRGLVPTGAVGLDRRGRFRLVGPGRALAAGHERSLNAWVRYQNLRSTQDAWGALPSIVRTGEPGFQLVHGTSVWSHFAEHPEEERLFASAMREVTRMVLPMIAGGYPWPESGTVCDVAGGTGTLLAAVLERRPGLRGILVDAPGVLREAEGHLAERGVGDRVELREGDMFEHVDAAADLYILKDVLHDWDDARCAQILRTVRAPMPAGSRVVLAETVQERDEPDPLVSLIDLQMLTQCDGGRQRSVGELHRLLEQADLRPGAVHLTAGPALLEGIAG